LREPEDLSDVLQVAIGSATEAVNVAFFERRTKRLVTNRGSERLSMHFPYMAATVDGYTDNGMTIFEAKTVSAFAKPEEIRSRYYPQLTHYMIVCDLRQAVLSVIYGNGHKFEQYDVELDDEYAEILIRAEERFWDCVQTGEPPYWSGWKPPAPPVEAIRIADMGHSNEWGSAASEWLENLSASKKFAKAAETIKGLVKPDVVEAVGHGISAKRNKAGSISIKEIK
jgi:predicted phage-related endonuclease